jgi:hypothetical protein
MCRRIRCRYFFSNIFFEFHVIFLFFLPLPCTELIRIRDASILTSE